MRRHKAYLELKARCIWVEDISDYTFIFWLGQRIVQETGHAYNIGDANQLIDLTNLYLIEGDTSKVIARLISKNEGG